MTGTKDVSPIGGMDVPALSTAIWDAWLCDETAARARLDGEGTRSILETADLWQKKEPVLR